MRYKLNIKINFKTRVCQFIVIIFVLGIKFDINNFSYNAIKLVPLNLGIVKLYRNVGSYNQKTGQLSVVWWLLFHRYWRLMRDI